MTYKPSLSDVADMLEQRGEFMTMFHKKLAHKLPDAQDYYADVVLPMLLKEVLIETLREADAKLKVHTP